MQLLVTRYHDFKYCMLQAYYNGTLTFTPIQMGGSILVEEYRISRRIRELLRFYTRGTANACLERLGKWKRKGNFLRGDTKLTCLRDCICHRKLMVDCMQEIKIHRGLDRDQTIRAVGVVLRAWFIGATISRCCPASHYMCRCHRHSAPGNRIKNLHSYRVVSMRRPCSIVM